MDQQQFVFLLILFASMTLFLTDFVRVDIVGLLIILSLALTGILDSKEAFAGFSSEPAIIVSAVFVLSAALAFTGATERLGQWIARLSGTSETRALIVVMLGVAGLSAFTHHLMITAMMLPIVMELCKTNGFHSSRLLIPMATAASLGTTLTIIGAPAFLLTNEILGRSGLEKLGFFEVARVGLPVTIASFILILILRWLLPKNTGTSEVDERFKLSEISTELVIPEKSRWIGKTLADLKAETEKRFTILSVFRRHKPLRMSETSQVLERGDIILVETTSDELVSIEEKLGLALRAVKKFGKLVAKEHSSLSKEEHRLFQGVIAPRSEFIGRTLSQLRFFHRFGVVAIGIWRKSGWIREEIPEVVLREGDLVVLWGPEENVERLSEHRGFLMFLPFHGKPKQRIKMGLAFAIMAGSIACASSGFLPSYVAFVLGAVLMVLTGCIPVEKAYDSIETKVFVMIAGVIPMGIAMEKTGVDKLAADFIFQFTQGWEPIAMLLVFFWFAALLTQILSDAATTVLIAPIAIAFAKSAQISPVAAVVTVTIGAIASFLTPIGHHGNLLILSPGGYRFADFLKIGLPITVVISLLTAYLSLLAWS